MQDHSLGSQVTCLGDPTRTPGQELGPADGELVVFAEAWGPTKPENKTLILHHTHQHLGGQDGGDGRGGEAQTDRQTETDGQRARDMKSYRSGAGGREFEIGEGEREKEKIYPFPFLSLSL